MVRISLVCRLVSARISKDSLINPQRACARKL